ncbi:MAG TPA: TadE family protein [Chloroflexota bacterium]|nr:TadE family protein [Chloroflexota bacterium]
MKRLSRGAALMEFALAWPIVLLLVLGAVEMAVWESESAAAREAALAGARAGTVAGAGVDAAAQVTLRALSSSLVGVSGSIWCPRDPSRAPALWVCATDLGAALEVDIGGWVPSLVPIVPGRGLPLRAHVVFDKERFSR